MNKYIQATAVCLCPVNQVCICKPHRVYLTNEQGDILSEVSRSGHLSDSLTIAQQLNKLELRLEIIYNK